MSALPVIAAAAVLAGGTLWAADQGPAVPTAAGEAALDDPWVMQPIAAELPAAPQRFARWIETAQVTFDFYAPQREPFRFAAETRFKFDYQFRARTQWQLIVDPHGDLQRDPHTDSSVGTAEAVLDQPLRRRRGSATGRSTGRAAARRTSTADDVQTGVDTASRPDEAKSSGRLEIRVTYEDVSLTVSHRVRLPIATVGQDFFEHPLVQHEFDHVAISGNPKLQAQLLRMLRERAGVIIEPVKLFAPSKPPNLSIEQTADIEQQRQQYYTEIAHAAVRRHSDRVFAEFVEAVKIRHRELDRVTSHGAAPLDVEQRARLIGSDLANQYGVSPDGGD